MNRLLALQIYLRIVGSLFKHSESFGSVWKTVRVAKKSWISKKKTWYMGHTCIKPFIYASLRNPFYVVQAKQVALTPRSNFASSASNCLSANPALNALLGSIGFSRVLKLQTNRPVDPPFTKMTNRRGSWYHQLMRWCTQRARNLVDHVPFKSGLSKWANFVDPVVSPSLSNWREPMGQGWTFEKFCSYLFEPCKVRKVPLFPPSNLRNIQPWDDFLALTAHHQLTTNLSGYVFL